MKFRNPMLFAALTGCSIYSLSAFAQLDLPDVGGIDEQPKATLEDVMPASKKPAKMEIPVKAEHDSAGFSFTLNFPGELRVGIETGDSKKTFFTIVPASQKFLRKKSESESFGRTKIEITEPEPEFKNQMLNIRGLDITYCIRPKFLRYKHDTVDKLMADWEKLPDALSKTVRFDARPSETGINIYIDGHYAGTVKGSRKLAKLHISGGQGPSITNAQSYVNRMSTKDFEALDFGQVANSGAMKGAKVSLASGIQQVNDIPMIVNQGAKSSDLSLVKATRGLELLEVDYNLSRDAFDRLPESQMIAVPLAYYTDAYILFALDPSKDKERAMTVRMTRFCDGDGRGTALANTDVKLPADDTKFPENIKKVGTVTLDGRELPLYLGKFSIDTGELLDIIDNDPHPRQRNKKNPYLDFEIFGSRGGIGAYGTGHMKPSGRKSAFNVFGVTLERSPVELHLKQSQPGNIFNNDDVPQATAILKAQKAGTYVLEWAIGTLDGKDVYPDRLDWEPTAGNKEFKREKVEVTLKEGESKDINVPLAMPDLGHYTLEFNLYDKQGNRKLFDHKAFFALLGKDDRLATAEESPFGSWWTKHHHGTANPDIALKIFNKAGIRRVPPGCGGKDAQELSREATDKYKITINQYGWAGDFKVDDKEKAYAYFEEAIDPFVKRFPECKSGLIFHESYGDPLPPEILGEKKVYSESELNKDLMFAERARLIAEYYRGKFPDVKLIYGNNTSSSGLIAALLRNNYDVKLIDYIGLESPGQGCVSERLWQGGTQGAWFARETARLIGGHELKLTGCFEYSARPRRILGYQRQAEYYMRDGLVGLAYGFQHLGLSGLSDPGNGYNQTVWGDGGLCERNPNLYPKPMYVAYATMTKALDQAKFQRKMDTGSNVAYAHEYARKRGDFAYPCWTPKQDVELTFTFPKDTECEYLDFYGKISKMKGRTFVIKASTSPGYVISPVKADSVKVTKRINPEAPKNLVVADKLDDLSKWNIISYPCSLSETGWDIFRRPGKFEVKEVKDDEKGKCIEFKLIKEGKKPDVFAEYTKIELKKPIALAGEPDKVGVWVKGDGGWGKIGFEIQDSNGYLWRTEGMWHDFPGDLYINFDGWRFVTFDLRGAGKKPLVNQSLGAYWNSNGGKSITYPVKLNGLYITLNRKALDPTDMKDVAAVIRIKDIGSMENEYAKIKE